MNRLLPGLRKPVKRQGAESFLLIMLLSFAGSVTATRLFLELTGYPQLGGGGLHIAHVLWGGLFLFLAALLPLIYANRWVYTIGAIMGGLGVGLFIDEVGKFITQNNDYFYPAAAPLIYAFFLLTVLLYMQVRRSFSRDARAELYRALDAIEEVLDHDLDDEEQAEIQARLKYVAENAQHPDLTRLASILHDFLAIEELYLAPRPPTLFLRAQMWFNQFEAKHLSRLRLRAALAGGMGAVGMIALSKLGILLISRFSPAPLEQTLLSLMEAGIMTSSGVLNFFLVRVALEGVIGFSLFLSAVLLAIGNDRRGIVYGYLALLGSLTVVNVLIFYFDQFSTIVIAIIQFVLLMGILYYRRRFLQEPPSEPRARSSHAR